MPVGIFTNCGAIILGGFVGLLIKRFLKEELKESLILYFGFGAIIIGIISIVRLDSLPIVVLSLILGSLIGELLNIDGNLKKFITFILFKTSKDIAANDVKKRNIISIIIVIFCFSGTGIFGVLSEGMFGDSSILMAKSVLDFFTAAIFATSIGLVVSFIAIPQFIIFISLFFVARLIGPHLTASTLSNFVAAGGVITLMLGINLTKIKEIKVLNCIPTFVVVIILSHIFS